jgi:hypothetical protein
MMVKSMPRKSMSFQQLLEYVNQPKEKGRVLLQNFRTKKDDPPAIHREFLGNARRLSRRKNGNLLYHEILSFSDLDKARVTPAIIEDLTRFYLARRAPYALAYGKAHFNTDCPHIHLVISANNFGSASRNRLTKAQFRAVIRELEDYQRERYPALSHSLVLAPNPSKPRSRRAEHERRSRLRQQGKNLPSQKETMRALVLRELAASPSGEILLRNLGKEGIRLTCRGRTVTVEDTSRPKGRRYRLATLGLEGIFWKAVRQWEQAPERLAMLQALERERAPAPERIVVQHVREDFSSGLSLPTEENRIRERLEVLARIETEKGQRDHSPER